VEVGPQDTPCNGFNHTREACSDHVEEGGGAQVGVDDVLDALGGGADGEPASGANTYIHTYLRAYIHTYVQTDTTG
jgi:hypothetical protein